MNPLPRPIAPRSDTIALQSPCGDACLDELLQRFSQNSLATHSGQDAMRPATLVPPSRKLLKQLERITHGSSSSSRSSKRLRRLTTGKTSLTTDGPSPKGNRLPPPAPPLTNEQKLEIQYCKTCTQRFHSYYEIGEQLGVGGLSDAVQVHLLRTKQAARPRIKALLQSAGVHAAKAEVSLKIVHYDAAAKTDRVDLDTINEIRIANALNMLTVRALSPNFIMMLDHFLCSDVRSRKRARSNADGTTEPVGCRRTVQHIIYERLDLSIPSFLATETRAGIGAVRAIIFQTTHALHVAWQSLRLIHNDAHLGNLMLLDTQMANPPNPLGLDWLFMADLPPSPAISTFPKPDGYVAWQGNARTDGRQSRRGWRVAFRVPYTDTLGYLVKFLDFGLSRAAVPTDPTRAATGPSEVIGVEGLEASGISVGAPDLGYDLRKFMFMMLWRLSATTWRNLGMLGYDSSTVFAVHGPKPTTSTNDARRGEEDQESEEESEEVVDEILLDADDKEGEAELDAFYSFAAAAIDAPSMRSNLQSQRYRYADMVRIPRDHNGRVVMARKGDRTDRELALEIFDDATADDHALVRMIMLSTISTGDDEHLPHRKQYDSSGKRIPAPENSSILYAAVHNLHRFFVHAEGGGNLTPATALYHPFFEPYHERSANLAPRMPGVRRMNVAPSEEVSEDMLRDVRYGGTTVTSAMDGLHLQSHSVPRSACVPSPVLLSDTLVCLGCGSAHVVMSCASDVSPGSSGDDNAPDAFCSSSCHKSHHSHCRTPRAYHHYPHHTECYEDMF